MTTIQPTTPVLAAAALARRRGDGFLAGYAHQLAHRASSGAPLARRPSVRRDGATPVRGLTTG